MANINPSANFKPPPLKPEYSIYKSPHGPKYTVQPNIHGWTLKSTMRFGLNVGAFGGVAGFFALYFLSDVPRVKRDILQKIPIIGDHFVKEIPPSDNV